jgi:hypothetical protein
MFPPEVMSSTPSMSSRHVFLSALALTVLLSGCREGKVANYQTPKETLPPVVPAPDAPAAAPDMASIPVPTGNRHLEWNAPSHWTPGAASAMRKGSYAIRGDAGDADLSITSFPGDTSGLLANMNRWRGQIGLSPQTAAQLEAEVQHIDVGPLHFDVVDYAGSANGIPTRIIGAVLALPGETWFFKLMGPDALVAQEKAAFLAFIETVRIP